MIKKIANWTFGSVFRTFGRIIAYLIFGLALSYILSSLDFRITDLFLDKVKASTANTAYTTVNELDFPTSAWLNRNSDTITTNEINLQSIMYDNANGNMMQYFANYGTMNSNTTDNYFLTIATPNTFVANHVYAYTIYVKAKLPNGNEGNYPVSPNDVYDVDMWYSGYNMSGSNAALQFFNSLYIGELYMSIDYDVSFESNVYALVYIIKTNYNGNYIRVPVKFNQGANNFRFFGYKLQDLGYASDYLTGLIQSSGLATARSVQEVQQQLNGIDSSVQQQTQQQQQQHNETMNYLQDSNTTQAEEDAQGFFDDFDVPDVGGLSAIITAPLNTIRSLLSSTCSKLILPLPYVNKNLELPCMNEIYTEHFGLFFSLYQTIMLAIISYRCIRSIYFDITGFTNPDDDRIEVMDL